MKYVGRCVHWDDTIVEWPVSAAVADDRVSIEWVEGGERGYLVATKVDMFGFRGNYGYSEGLKDYCLTELRKYASGEALIFSGTWQNKHKGWEGEWIFFLYPESPKNRG